MKAATIDRSGPASELRYVDIDLPGVGPKDVRVKISAAAVNPVDVKTRSGALGIDLQFPSVLGWDLAGTVDVIGAEVTKFRVGDAVMGMIAQPVREQGTYAEYVSVSEDLLAPVPKGLSLEEAAAAPLTVLASAQILSKIDMPENASVLVTGAAGAVGRVTVQTLVKKGHQVSGIARTTDETDLTNLGVRAIYSTSEQVPDGVFDVVIDTAGIAASISGVRDGGEFISIADNLQPQAQRGITPKKSYVQENADQLAAIAIELARGNLTVPVGPAYPLSEAAAAHAAFEQGGTRGKVLIVP
ncbi:NADP-dependent oxidoreductase [Cryobacterium sp. M15]|jgi:NADPH:quinone reductase-like Zn-dependent oxidoreductase|uniref:NADP-dependent oxidoreductase n=1 Tax=Cryobacterium sp. M15 TaxID=2048291 RepID=UPI000CE52A2D|nr:NADP-dependent oxidoreductase [Cryobacterium sp. M15]